MAVGVEFCFISGFILRFCLFRTSFPEWLSSRVEISTPLTSWKRVMEGLSLSKHLISPYSGDLFHETPLMLRLLDFLLKIFSKNDCYIFLAVDLISGFVLLKIAHHFGRHLLKTQALEVGKYAEDTESLLLRAEHLHFLKFYVVAVHFFSPYSIAACLARSTGVFHNLLILLTFLFTLKGKEVMTTICLALASYQSLYPIILSVPAAIYFYMLSDQSVTKSYIGVPAFLSYMRTVTMSGFWLALLLLISYRLEGFWNFLFSTYGFILSVPDLTPNIGIFWYFFTEMFEHFRIFFLFVFQINTIIYTIPLSIRLRERPLFLMYILTFLIGIFKSYPSYSDVALVLCLLPLWKHLYKYLRNSFIVTCMFISCTVFSPILWHLWLYAGSANANFYFAITLVFTTAEIFLVTDLLYAFLRREFDLSYGLNRKLDNGKEAQIVLG